MENQEPLCPVCGAAMKYIPAGTSKKTNRPYNAFWGCTTYGCKGTVRIPAEPQKSQEGASTHSTARPSYDAFPKKDLKTTMDYKAGQIAKAQDAKEESIKIASSGRDAVLIATTFYANDTLSDDQIKTKITEWRDWMYKNIYTMDDDTYKSLNVPFN